MIIVKLQGGLGNQMFQYAFGLSVSQRQKAKLYLDNSFFTGQQPGTDIALRQFDLNVFAGDFAFTDPTTVKTFTNPGKLQKTLNNLKIGRKRTYTEASLRVNEDALMIHAPAYFDGYWQSEVYFKDLEYKIRKAYSFNKQLNQASQKLADELMLKTNAVSIHVRRGDYISSERTNQIHGTCSTSYYLNAIELVREKIADPEFYLFTDDPAWVKDTLMPVLADATLVIHNRAEDSWQDMALMSKCSHHIIANSSFSWWGAWLNPNKDKIVVAPKYWFKTHDHYFDDSDILPQSWIKISND
ncbi:hypothetical protein A0256_10580 [Mucilaginibacter sp. PAMC 26640]|nr:hypothetical protein A0256_10580 [Mucilaginibacter sp. PAMC 26640]